MLMVRDNNDAADSFRRTSNQRSDRQCDIRSSFSGFSYMRTYNRIEMQDGPSVMMMMVAVVGSGGGGGADNVKLVAID